MEFDKLTWMMNKTIGSAALYFDGLSPWRIPWCGTAVVFAVVPPAMV
jgi:hypothetical protein